MITKPVEGSVDYLQAIVDSLEDELIVIDKDYHIIEANQAVLRRHGKSRAEVIGTLCYEISHGLPELCHPPRDECPIREAWEKGKAARVTHCHLYGEDNSQRRYVDVIVSPIKNERGETIAMVEVLRDVTDSKELELKITEAHRNLLALNTIAGVVSQSLDLDIVLSSALEKTLEIMQVTTGGILLWDEKKKLLCYRAHHGLSSSYVQNMCLRPGEGIAGQVAQTGKALLVEDISTDPRAIRPDLINAEGLRAFASVPLRAHEKVLGVLNLASEQARRFSAEDIQLLNSIASQIAIAVDNAKLHQQVQQQDKVRGELLREVFSIQEEERRRIARELHDETSQALASLAASLEATAAMLPAGAEKVRKNLKDSGKLSISILDEIHRLIYELRPSLLDDLGLVAAARWLADNNLKPAGIKVNFTSVGAERRLGQQLEATLFRAIQEAVTNIARHSGAKSARITLRFKKKSIRVTVEDNGRGFDVAEALASKERPRGLGLLGMKERIELMKGILKIDSRPGEGTKIDIEIPTVEEVKNG